MDTTAREVKGVIVNGHINLESQHDWPDGTPVVVTLAEVPSDKDTPEVPFKMMREEDWPTTPESVEEILARWGEHEAIEMSPEEEAELTAWRAERKRFEIEALRKQWGLTE